MYTIQVSVWVTDDPHADHPCWRMLCLAGGEIDTEAATVVEIISAAKVYPPYGTAIAVAGTIRERDEKLVLADVAEDGKIHCSIFFGGIPREFSHGTDEKTC